MSREEHNTAAMALIQLGVTASTGTPRLERVVDIGNNRFITVNRTASDEDTEAPSNHLEDIALVVGDRFRRLAAPIHNGS